MATLIFCILQWTEVIDVSWWWIALTLLVLDDQVQKLYNKL